MTGLYTFPDVKVHPKYDFMIASLDGITFDGEHIVEVKCPGAKTHAIALSGKVPDHYMPQLQHQLEVCGKEHMYYFSFDGNFGVFIEVLRDDSYIKELLEKELQFWYCMQNAIPPALKERDSTHKKDMEWKIMAEEWRSCKAALHDLEVLELKWRQKLIDACEGKNCHGSGVSVNQSFRKNKTGDTSMSWRISKSGEQFDQKLG
jgi:predicted phage-related endonuclease